MMYVKEVSTSIVLPANFVQKSKFPIYFQCTEQCRPIGRCCHHENWPYSSYFVIFNLCLLWVVPLVPLKIFLVRNLAGLLSGSQLNLLDSSSPSSFHYLASLQFFCSFLNSMLTFPGKYCITGYFVSYRTGQNALQLWSFVLVCVAVSFKAEKNAPLFSLNTLKNYREKIILYLLMPNL